MLVYFFPRRICLSTQHLYLFLATVAVTDSKQYTTSYFSSKKKDPSGMNRELQAGICDQAEVSCKSSHSKGREHFKKKR